ncbi:MAG: hypothetical protein JO191_03130 [Mycobacteriaceae bacterium]|nr:hypothetical protein [Mycobacteriaceae bacterium]
MSRTRAMANGHRPHAIGVTFSDDSQAEASLLLKSLTDAGFDNIVAVRSPAAGEALARGIGRAVGYELTAVCLLEPDSVVVSMVDSYDGAVQSVAHHDHDTDAELIDWLADVFDVNDWHPQCLIVVGPDAELTALARQLEHALDLPVFAPPEAELALARGAALASADGPQFNLGGYDPSVTVDTARTRFWPLPYTAALTMLVVGILAFVVSVSLVAGLKLTSNTGSRGMAQPPAAKPSAPPIAQVVAPPAAPPPVEVTPPQAAVPTEPSSTPSADVPVSPAEEASAGQPDQVPETAAAPPPDAAPPPAASLVPPAAPTVPPEPDAKPPLLTRILSHIPGLHQDPQPPPAPADGPGPDAPPPPP